MNHETAIAMAVVLAVIVITIIYGLISGGIDMGEEGIGNLSDRADSDNPSFASYTDKNTYLPNQPEKLDAVEQKVNAV